jgi:glutamate synthase domain-containing protein 3
MDGGVHHTCVQLQEHHKRTGSLRAAAILEAWQAEVLNFWQLVPPSERDTPEATRDSPFESIDAAPAVAA